MTSSGAFSFAPENQDILMEAWERLQKDPASLTGPIADSAMRSLNLMLAGWATRGINFFALEAVEVALVEGTAGYATSEGTLDVLNMTLELTTLNPGIERAMRPIGRSEWANIADKTLPGAPTQYWVEKILPTPVIHLFPTPDSNPATISYYRIRQFYSATALALETPDAPWLYYDALAAGLAARLAEKYAPELFDQKRGLAGEAYEAAFREDRERVPMTLLPDFGSAWG